MTKLTLVIHGAQAARAAADMTDAVGVTGDHLGLVI